MDRIAFYQHSALAQQILRDNFITPSSQDGVKFLPCNQLRRSNELISNHAIDNDDKEVGRLHSSGILTNHAILSRRCYILESVVAVVWNSSLLLCEVPSYFY
jgi:hypothetical protein